MNIIINGKKYKIGLKKVRKMSETRMQVIYCAEDKKGNMCDNQYVLECAADVVWREIYRLFGVEY